MASQYPKLQEWLEDDIIPKLPTEQKILHESLKRIDPDNLRTKLNQKVTNIKLNTMIQDTKTELRELKAPLATLSEVAASLEECEGCEEQIAEVDKHVRDVIETMRILEFRQEALTELREFLYHHDQEEAPKLDTELSKRLEEKLVEWNKLSIRKKFGGDRLYRDFRTGIWNAKGKGAGVFPSIKSFLPAGEGELESDESSDEEVAMGGSTQITKCPLCIKWLTKPVRSNLCNHPLCQKCFQDYLIQMKSKVVNCPYTGCSQRISEAIVDLDPDLEQQVKRAKRQQDQEAEKDDTDNDPFEDEQTREAENKNVKTSSKKGTQGKKKKVVVADSDDE
ncbi:hypothetical protein CROQUDRAFT_51434 [Cronartium quercuum f. sp. fusiforme G11]|uniref:RING-type domain-containing protein n=1 Tax=Cronartium quercuum f. sp. fusiforme G11 TaxID=708437 RepID=A0A9P6T774_9BASI|nr:hypothetical protein CROQUDRAFT_51434 [Cronartium quercuum f. sp. fusiforme G11]